MSTYTLSVKAISSYSSLQPSLTIWNDNLQESSTLIGREETEITATLSYSGGLPSSLQFGFNDGQSESGRQINILSVQINGRHVNANNFLSTQTLGEGSIASLDIIAADFLFIDTQPDVSIFANPTVVLSDGADTYRNYSNVNAVIDALGGRDSIYLGAGSDRVHGGGGIDIIKTGADNDLIDGGDDNDRLYGEAGDDEIYGGHGNDKLYGQDGNDYLFGGIGNDVLAGGNDNDVLVGEEGDDNLNGGLGNDVMYGDAGDDSLVGAAGFDTLDGGAGNDILYGGADDDVLNGGLGDDMLYGDIGNDVLFGNEGVNSLNGQAGNDTLYGGSVGVVDPLVTGILAANAGVIYSAVTNSFYQHISSAQTWTAAKGLAESLTLSGLNGVSGHLVTITSAAENAIVDGLLSSGKAWIGATDSAVEGAWRWDAGPEAGAQFWAGGAIGVTINSNYHNWAALNPANLTPSRDYASIGSTGSWQAELQTTALGYIVEWEAGSLLTEIDYTVMNGGVEADILYGSVAGRDVFVIDQLDAVDTIYGFSAAHHDTLDISGILDFDFALDNIRDFVRFTETGGDTYVSVDGDGTDNGVNFTHVATLEDVTGLSRTLMVANDSLIMS
jgi:Ca2+-binding RTX toxin-like protein